MTSGSQVDRPPTRPVITKAGTRPSSRLAYPAVGRRRPPSIGDLAMTGSLPQPPPPAALSAAELSALLVPDRDTGEPSTPSPRSVLLLLDCRPLGLGRHSMIAGAKAVLCSPVRRQRNNGRMPIGCIVSDDELAALARLGSSAIIVLYDEESDSFECAATDSIMRLAADCVAVALPGAYLRFLKGGYKGFEAAFPQHCTNGKAQLVPSAAPHCTPPPSAGLKWLDVRGPNEVLPYLYIGSLEDVADVEKLKWLGITAVISVCREGATLPGTFDYLNVSVDDDQSVQIADWFKVTWLFIEKCRKASGKALVHCHAGISRSATVCLAYLIKAKGWSVDESLEFLRRARPCVNPNFGFMIELIAYAEQLKKEAAEDAAASVATAVEYSEASLESPRGC